MQGLNQGKVAEQTTSGAMLGAAALVTVAAGAAASTIRAAQGISSSG